MHTHFVRNYPISIAIVVAASVFSIAAVSFAAIVSGNSTTGSSSNVTITQLTLAKPASAAEGNILIATISTNDGAASNVTPPAGWTQILRTNNSNNVALLSYWKVVGASEPSSYQWQITPSTNAVGGITPYSGVDTSNPIDVSDGSTGHSKIAIAPSITTTEAGDEVVALFAQSARGSFSTPTGMTEKYDINRSSGPSLASDEALQAAAGPTGSKSSNLSPAASRQWATQTIALRQVSAPPPPPSTPIAFDAGVSNGGINPSVAITRGTSASNYVGIATAVCVSAGTVSGVTWGGSAMTQLMDEAESSGAGHAYWFYIINPSTGSQTVAAASSAICQLSALTYSGVNQSTPFDTNFDGASHSYVKNLNASVSPGTEVTTTGTTHVDNSYAVLADNYQVDITGGANATERVPKAVYDRGSVTHPAGSVSIGILNNSGSNELIDTFMIALQPAN
ncbi:hypothetical protein HY968_00945 [Candidatus Kaiserbacteria bacterium]|nr:hypothetical protein [Candidatus Kaiserbacteria bacterium]